MEETKEQKEVEILKSDIFSFQLQGFNSCKIELLPLIESIRIPEKFINGDKSFDTLVTLRANSNIDGIFNEFVTRNAGRQSNLFIKYAKKDYTKDSELYEFIAVCYIEKARMTLYNEGMVGMIRTEYVFKIAPEKLFEEKHKLFS